VKFHTKLEKLRTRIQYTQFKLAKDVGVSRQTISYWESGFKIPSLKNFRKLCSVLLLNSEETTELKALYEPELKFRNKLRGRPSKPKTDKTNKTNKISK
jgi:DNA-binding XRE family transcriptional regulator